MSGNVTHFEAPSSDIEAAVAPVREVGGTAEDPVKIPSGAYTHRTDDQGVEFGLSQQAGDHA